MWDDEGAGVALRALRDEPAPPSVVTVEQVIRRGRRRVRAQRFGVLSLVIALVASAGVGMVLLRSWTSMDQAIDNSPLLNVEPWPAQLGGWSLVAKPNCEESKRLWDDLSAPLITTVRLTQTVAEPAFLGAITEATGGSASVVWSSWERPRHTYLEVSVPVGDAVGTVRFEATAAMGGPPAKAADADVGVYGTCEVPLRRILDSGTVLQLYAPDVRSPYAPVQHVRAYRPDGALYTISSAGWSAADIQPVAGDPGGVVTSGRGRLPLDSQELADVAVRMAALG